MVGWKANLLNALSYMIGMLGLLYIYYRISVDIKLSLIVLYLPVGMISLCYIVYRYIKLYHVKTTKSHYIAILRRSSGFFFYFIIDSGASNRLYGHFSRLTPADIVQYTVTMKIFGLVFLFILLFCKHYGLYVLNWESNSNGKNLTKW